MSEDTTANVAGDEQPTAEPEPIYESNSSGTNGPLPLEFDRLIFNSGAFFGGFIWAIGNRTWLGLVDLLSYALLPLAPVWRLFMGLRGYEWAWRARKWESVAQFKRVQQRWAWIGLALFLVQSVGVLSLLVQTGSCLVPAATTSSGG